MKEQITINQHYIPRFYMKPFSNIKNEGNKNEKALISFYQFNNKLMKDNIPTNSICSEDYFYDQDGTIENKLSKKEMIWSVSIFKINNEEEILDDDITNIKEFTIYQILRTKAMLLHSGVMVETIMNNLLLNLYPDIEQEKIEELIKDKIKKDITPEFELDLVDGLISSIDDLDIEIIYNKTNINFITSDVPVIVVNPLGIFHAGLGDVGELVFFPISGNKLIVFYDKKFFGSIPKEIYNANVIHTFNKYQYISADERILSNDSSIFNGYVEDITLNEYRDCFRSQKNTHAYFEGKGTLFKAKSRSIKYYYAIPIFKLPNQIKKIHEKFRETFPRQYSKDMRKNILFRIYVNPKSKSSAADLVWIERQKYSKILLDYLDYYWNTPKEDRVITAEEMKMFHSIHVESIKNTF